MEYSQTHLAGPVYEQIVTTSPTEDHTMSPRTDAIMSAPIVIQENEHVVNLHEMGIEQDAQLRSDPMLAQRPTQQMVAPPPMATAAVVHKSRKLFHLELECP